MCSTTAETSLMASVLKLLAAPPGVPSVTFPIIWNMGRYGASARARHSRGGEPSTSSSIDTSSINRTIPSGGAGVVPPSPSCCAAALLHQQSAKAGAKRRRGLSWGSASAARGQSGGDFRSVVACRLNDKLMRRS
jgi:hypothetical protein